MTSNTKSLQVIVILQYLEPISRNAYVHFFSGLDIDIITSVLHHESINEKLNAVQCN
jgi:hypothetical protein